MITRKKTISRWNWVWRCVEIVNLLSILVLGIAAVAAFYAAAEQHDTFLLGVALFFFIAFCTFLVIARIEAANKILWQWQQRNKEGQE